jgi:broad specificity phosphatase PhoE
LKPLRVTLSCPPLTAAQRAGRFPEADTALLAAVPALADLRMGRWAGVSLKHVQVAEPQAFHAWLSDAGFRGHGGESFNDLCERVAGWLQAVETGHGPHQACVSPWVVRAAVAYVLRLDYQGAQAIDAPPCSQVTLTFTDRWRLALGVQATPDTCL